MHRKKVVHLTTVHNRFDNRIFQKECLSLAAASYEVTLLISDGKGNESYKGVFIKDLGSYPGLLKRIVFQSFKFFVHAIREKAAVYHFHDPELIVTGLLLKITGKKVIYDIHEDYTTAIIDRDYTHPFLAKIFSRLYHIIEKTFTIGAQKIIAERYYSYRFPKSVAVLNYPKIEEEVSTPVKEDSTGPRDKIKLLYTGNVTLERGAVHHASIVKKIGWARVKYTGHCPVKVYEQIKQSVGEELERIEMVGLDHYVPFSEIKEEYQKEDYLAGLAVFPWTRHYYQKELTKLFEYMQAGLPIICSDFPVWKNIVEVNRCGITVDPEKPDELVDAIDYLKNHPEKAEEMANNGRDAVKKKYNWFVEENKLLKLYEQLSERTKK